MRKLSILPFRHLSIICLILLLWGGWGSANVLAQTDCTSSPGCCTCTVSGSEGCTTNNGAIMGWHECECKDDDDCFCKRLCALAGPVIDLEKIQNGEIELPASGMRLAAIPSAEYFDTLDAAVYETGETMVEVYFSENFGLVYFQEGEAVAYPLENPSTFTIYNCEGTAVAQAHRAERTADG